MDYIYAMDFDNFITLIIIIIFYRYLGTKNTKNDVIYEIVVNMVFFNTFFC